MSKTINFIFFQKLKFMEPGRVWYQVNPPDPPTISVPPAENQLMPWNVSDGPGLQVDYYFYVTDLEVARRSWTDDRAFYPSTVTYGLTFAFGLIGNMLVLVALLGDRRSSRSLTTVCNLVIIIILHYNHLTASFPGQPG